MQRRILGILRSAAAVIAGYITVAAGTIVTFNVLVGQVTVHSTPQQLLLGTIGAMIAGLAGGLVAGLISARYPFLHAAGVLLLIAVDTASVLAKGGGPVWFDLAGSSVLAIAILIGGWIVGRMSPIRTGHLAARPTSSL